MRCPPHSRAGFTLVELLIVVAIISILAALALVNFSEAQTRSKVARTHNDLRVIATGLECYRVDTNRYPVAPRIDTALSARLAHLTTPIAYLTGFSEDPFAREDPGQIVSGREPYYVYASGNLYAGGAGQFASDRYYNTIYSIAGRGPDGDTVFGGYCMAHPQAIRGRANIRGAYDPTNGTISAGDILRLSPGRLDE